MASTIQQSKAGVGEGRGLQPSGEGDGEHTASDRVELIMTEAPHA